MQKTATDWSVGNPVTATHLNQFNTDLTTIFQELSNENLNLTYDVQGNLTQVVDNENSITINISWVDYNASLPALPKLYIQKLGDPKKWTVSYDANGYISTIVYA